jgi:NADPH:quinone reductase-like Zn-dependent oxidoreductase
MQAAVQERYGPPEVVRVIEIDRPVPADDEVLVSVRAASVNRADLDGLGPRPGFLRPIIGLRAPRNPSMGIDVAGVVESVGSAATRFRPGDRVFADLFSYGQGAFAEFVSAKEKAFGRDVAWRSGRARCRHDRRRQPGRTFVPALTVRAG